ncbi:MAG: hypothetical protein WD115_03155 [Balneolaceae bacterium]
MTTIRNPQYNKRMIQLVRPETSLFADEIEEIFRSWVLAYQSRVEPISPEDRAPLYIMDGREKIEGREAILSWLQVLERELSIQRSVSGDGCYLDPKTGETC